VNQIEQALGRPEACVAVVHLHICKAALGGEFPRQLTVDSLRSSPTAFPCGPTRSKATREFLAVHSDVIARSPGLRPELIQERA